MRLVIVEPLARCHCWRWSLLVLWFLYFLCAVSMKSGKFIDCTYVALFSVLNTHIAQPKYFNLYAADVKNKACLPDRVVPPSCCISCCCCCSLGHLSRRIPQIIATLPAHISSTRYALMCQALIGSRAARKVGRSNTPCRCRRRCRRRRLYAQCAQCKRS